MSEEISGRDNRASRRKSLDIWKIYSVNCFGGILSMYISNFAEVTFHLHFSICKIRELISLVTSSPNTLWFYNSPKFLPGTILLSLILEPIVGDRLHQWELSRNHREQIRTWSWKKYLILLLANENKQVMQDPCWGEGKVDGGEPSLGIIPHLNFIIW